MFANIKKKVINFKRAKVIHHKQTYYSEGCVNYKKRIKAGPFDFVFECRGKQQIFLYDSK